MHSRDIYRQVAQLHADNISQGFLSSLGKPFLALLYESIDADGDSVLLLAETEGCVVGFVSGTIGMGSIYRQLARRWWRLTIVLFPALLSPSKVWKIAEIMLFGRKESVGDEVPNAELLSIAVDPAFRGQGHARKLYRGLIQNFKNREGDGFRIIVGESLSAAHKFYVSMGACLISETEVHKGQKSLVYAQKL
jgi:ribosomal protein S18 acetylase RimI-like enzyme